MVNIYGYIYNLSAAPVKGASVSVRALGDQAPIICLETYTVKTNALGYFEMQLIEGTAVDIFIPSMNYRRTLEVPNVDSNLFEIP